jgi:hypothetical protein
MSLCLSQIVTRSLWRAAPGSTTIKLAPTGFLSAAYYGLMAACSSGRQSRREGVPKKVIA